MPRFNPTVKAAPVKKGAPVIQKVSAEAMARIKWMCNTPVTTKDPKYKPLVEGKLPHELILMADKLPNHTLRPVKGNPKVQEFVVVTNPVLTQEEYWAKQLRERQNDARLLGMPVPIGVTSWGESIMPTAEKKVFAPKSRTEPQETKKEEPAKPPRTIGIVQTIVDCLRGASKKKPITRDQILKILTKKFPERDPNAMKKTISSQVPGALKTEKGIVVSTDGKGGYWISK